MLKIITAALAAGLTFAAEPTMAQEISAASPFLPVAGEAAVALHVQQPLAEPLVQRGTAVIPYTIDNLRVLPIFGSAAASVSPRAGHLHVTVDDLPWHWADAGNTNTIVVAGLSAGRHRILLEVATPEHRVITGKTIEFDVPVVAAAHASH